MALHGLEIPVGVKKLVAVLDAIRADDQVNGLADGDSNSAKNPVIPGGGHRKLWIEQCDGGKNTQRLADLLRVLLVSHAQENLQLDKVTQEKVPGARRCSQGGSSGRPPPTKMVDPDGAIREYHRLPDATLFVFLPSPLPIQFPTTRQAP